MRFPVDKCPECDLDLTTAEPAKVTNHAGMAIGTCPSCGRDYIMVEVTPLPSPEPESIAASEVEKPRSRNRKVSEPKSKAKA